MRDDPSLAHRPRLEPLFAQQLGMRELVSRVRIDREDRCLTCGQMVGMTRRQARRMVRHESVITALIGAGLGMPLGIFLAGLVTVALRNEGLEFALPASTLVVFALIAVTAGILAAILPARRASRLNVLEALQYE